MNYAQRCSAAPLARYFLCAAVAIMASGCGADGGSGSYGTPETLPDTAPSSAPQSVSPPSISGTPATTVVAGDKYSFQPSVTDTSGDALTFSVQNLPSWATFDPATGVLSGTPSTSNVGSYQSIDISVSNGKATAQLAPFAIQVIAPASSTPTPPPDSPPSITGTPATSVQAGSHYAFQPSASDPDKNTLVFSIMGQPAWASFSAATGLLSGTPSSSNVGTYSNIIISVSDGIKSVSLPAFTIAVTALPPAPPTNSPPKITGTPGTTVQAGSVYSFQPVASDPDGNTLTFSIANKPSWATFSASTGHLTGTPATGNIGTYSNITISVSDGKVSVSLPTFSIQVTAPPAIPPAISGTPPTRAQVGTAYSFTPTATSASGKALSFSVQNKPSWASFSIATGQLSGTPATADAGTDGNIVISVSDGTTSAALPAFTITVASAPNAGTATLKWVAPSKNTDGSAITNLSGYVISYGLSASSLSQTVSISSPATTSYTVQNLGQGTWYFAVSATETDGTVSALSAVVSKTIQ
jgi:nitrite reductase/ring-hydroxylating ferredoxin subunit